MQISDDLGKFAALIGAAAATSDMASIPQTQATPGDGSASIALGFPPETFVARASGGEPPRGADMNGFLNRLSRAIQVLQAGYMGPFDASFAAGIGGYPAGAIVSGSAIGTFWVSTANNNVTVPGDSGAQWQSLFNGLATQASLTAEIARAQGVEAGLSSAVSTEASTRAAAITALQSSKQNVLGFTPVQQGGGSGQGSNKIYLGWSGSKLKAQVDSADQGNLATETWANGVFATQSSLASETSLRASADANVENQINYLKQAFGYSAIGISQTIAIPSWASSVEIKIWGGGGGGGSCQTGGANATNNASGGGGGAGGFSWGIFSISGATSLICTIGSGGGVQGNGGTTSVRRNTDSGNLVEAYGGAGAYWSATAVSAGASGGGSAGGTIMNMQGASGADGQCGNWVFAGNGASSMWGGGGRAGTGGGQTAYTFASGGGGAYDPNQSNNLMYGGGGGGGIVILKFIP